MRVIGSRYFGGVRTQSDWDFVAEDTPEMRAFLQVCGFKMTRYYKDRGLSNTTFWRSERHMAEIFLCQSERRRTVVREIIRYSHIFKFIRAKKSRMEVWWALERCIERLWVVWREARAIERAHRREMKRFRAGKHVEVTAEELLRQPAIKLKTVTEPEPYCK